MSKTKTKQCPACGAQVDVEQQHCPNCPHSFFQEDGVQQYRKGRSRQHYLWGVGVVVFFACAYKTLNFVMRFADADDTSYSPIRQAAEQLASTSTVKTAAAPAPGSPEAEEAQAREQVQRALSHGRVQVVKDEEAAPPAEGAKAPSPSASEDAAPADSGGSGSGVVMVTGAGAPSAPEEPLAKEWRLRGCVYDLVTLKPVPHATLVIKDAELNRRYELVTGADGRYRTTVPSLPDRGYVVAVEHSDYAQTYLDPKTNARRKTESQRREIARELTHVLDAPYSVQGSGRKPVVTDFYLAPLK